MRGGKERSESGRELRNGRERVKRVERDEEERRREFNCKKTKGRDERDVEFTHFQIIENPSN